MGIQTAFLSMLKQGKKLPERDIWPATLRVILDSMRDTGLIVINEGEPRLTQDGFKYAEQLERTQQKAESILKNVSAKEVESDMRLLMEIATKGIQREMGISAYQPLGKIQGLPPSTPTS